MPDPESDAAPSLVSEQEAHRSGPPRETCQRHPRGHDNEEDIPRGTRTSDLPNAAMLPASRHSLVCNCDSLIHDSVDPVQTVG